MCKVNQAHANQQLMREKVESLYQEFGADGIVSLLLITKSSFCGKKFDEFCENVECARNMAAIRQDVNNIAKLNNH